MKVALAVLFLSVSAVAQATAGVADACGPKDVVFDVKQDSSQHALAQPEAGKALVYFIQEGTAVCGSKGHECVAEIGLDGAWVGAFQHNSYFSVSVGPGEHHACVALQGKSALGDRKGLSHFIAEAGKVYYLGMRALEVENFLTLNVDPMDSDEGKYLIAISPLSVSQVRPPKK
ncbi:MAG: hypothetical protein ABSG84_09635 [Acidobacteriaceae bacterium]|jgi:hypothetical protein